LHKNVKKIQNGSKSINPKNCIPSIALRTSNSHDSWTLDLDLMELEKDQRFKEISASWKIYMEQNIRDQERRWNMVRFCGVICTLKAVHG